MVEIWPSVLAFFDVEVEMELEATDGQRPLWYEYVKRLYEIYHAYCTRTGQDLICGLKPFKEQLDHLIKGKGRRGDQSTYRHPVHKVVSRVFVGIKHKATAEGVFAVPKPDVATTSTNPVSVGSG
jgi:phage/plasmid-associated DNA primase